MSGKKSRPADVVREATETASKKMAPNEPTIGEEQSTVDYGPPAASPFAATRPPMLNVVDAPSVARSQYPGIYNPRRLSQAAIDAARTEGRRLLETIPANEAALYTIAVNSETGAARLMPKPTQVSNDAFVREMAQRRADLAKKVDAIWPELTIRQRRILEKMRQRLDFYVKGKKRGLQKPLTAVAIDKVLFRALEFQSSRRAAQLAFQARAARKNRHALQQKKRPIMLESGQSVGKSRRHQKKMVTKALIGDATDAAKAQAKQERAVFTARNKQHRVAVALARNNKVNPKDLPPGQVMQRQLFAPTAAIAGMPGAQILGGNNQ